MIYLFTSENNVQLSNTELESLSQQLPPSMVECANRYKRWQDSQAYLFGKVLLMEGLERLGLDRMIIKDVCYTQYNRPYLSAGIDFNISHSGKYVVCALSASQRVGIDIEEMRDIDFDVFKEQFTDDEWSSIQKAENLSEEFYRYWTLKEAVVKADGRGLNIPLKDVTIFETALVQKQKWYYDRFNIDPNYMLHVVSDSHIKEKIIVESINPRRIRFEKGCLAPDN